MAVELEVNNADGRLTPGSFCQVRWPVRRARPSLFVPSASVASIKRVGNRGGFFIMRILVAATPSALAVALTADAETSQGFALRRRHRRCRFPQTRNVSHSGFHARNILSSAALQ